MLPVCLTAWDEYPPLPKTVDELHVLQPIRVERCACGDYLRQYPGDHPAMVVRLHNQSVTHRQWSNRLDR